MTGADYVMAPKSTENTKVQEFQFHSVPKATKWETFQQAIYDPSKQEIFGRTKQSWYRLLVFYTIFYACLAVLFAVCMRTMLATLDDRAPKWKLDESLIGNNPGLGFRPISDQTSEGSLIWYDLNDPCTASKWVKLIDDFLAPYRVEQVGKNYQVCNFSQPIDEGDVCTVNVNSFGPCTTAYQYGYNTSSPCVFLKLNRIFGWEPAYTRKPSKDMPTDLQSAVKRSVELNQTLVWISCEGQQPVDRERIGGFKYYPNRGFPGYYFPYKNAPNYLSPLIAVRIMNVLPNTIVNVECRAWAENIKYNGGDLNREGSVHFEILVDDVRAS